MTPTTRAYRTVRIPVHARHATRRERLRAAIGRRGCPYCGTIALRPARHTCAPALAAHGRQCAGRCLTRAYALAAGGFAVVAGLHVALGW